MFNRKKVNRNQVLSKHQDFYFNYLNIKKHLLVKGQVIKCTYKSAVSSTDFNNTLERTYFCEVQKTHISNLHQKNNIHPAYEYVESNIFFNALNDGFLKEIKEVKNLKPVKSFSFLDILFC